MFDHDTIVDDTAAPSLPVDLIAEDHTPEDEDLTLRENAPLVHEHPKNTINYSWIFFGSHRMPHAEHLIPFRT